MSTPLLILLTALSANPAADDVPLFEMSKPFETTVVAQNGTLRASGGPLGISPNGGDVDPFAAGDYPISQLGYGFYAGYESVFLKPSFSSDAAFEFVDDPGSPAFTNVVQFDWDLEHSPRVWVGFVSPDGLGAQIRYWQFDHGTEKSAADPDGDGFYRVFFDSTNDFMIRSFDGETISARHDLKLDALDAEGTWHKTYARGSLTVTGGMRYVKMSQSYSAKAFDETTIFEVLAARHNFEGVGPTVSLFGRRRLGSTNFALFVNSRLSVIYGDTSFRIREFEPPEDTTTQLSSDGTALLPITELQLGTDWSTSLWGSTRLFLRAALEGQLWFDAGTGMNTVTNDFVNSPQEGNLGLFGFSIGGGLTY